MKLLKFVCFDSTRMAIPYNPNLCHNNMLIFNHLKPTRYQISMIQPNKQKPTIIIICKVTFSGLSNFCGLLHLLHLILTTVPKYTRHREEQHVKMEGQTSHRPRARRLLTTTEAKRQAWVWFSLINPGWNELVTSWFQTSSLLNNETVILCCFNRSSL